MILRAKLKNSQVRLFELANYLNISRPTLYRYLQLYEDENYDQVEKKSLDLLTFIHNSRLINRPIIMDY